jgi:hypothetical protein
MAYFLVIRYVTILSSSNKLLNLKYIHHYFFLKFSNKKFTVRLLGREIWYVTYNIKIVPNSAAEIYKLWGAHTHQVASAP